MRYNPYCKNLKTRVFDIETTGLYPNSDHIISASFINPDGTDLLQLFSEAPQNEDIIVEQILEELKKCDAVITYNGNMFDLPFVLKRAQRLHAADELPVFWPIDVYRWLKSYWPKAKEMPSLKQKSVEEALGLSEKRTDEISGGECIDLYNRYVLWNESEAKDLILLHNGDDVRQLAKITEKLSFLPYHKIVFEKGYGMQGRIFEPCKLSKSKLAAAMQIEKGMLSTDIYNDSFHAVYDPESGRLEMDIFTSVKGIYQFVDLKSVIDDLAPFETLEGFESGFLILRKGENIYYRECVLLCKMLMNKLFYVKTLPC